MNNCNHCIQYMYLSCRNKVNSSKLVDQFHMKSNAAVCLLLRAKNDTNNIPSWEQIFPAACVIIAWSKKFDCSYHTCIHVV